MIKRANPTVVYHGVNIGSGSYPCNVYMELDANGEFVLYEDHLAAITEKDREIEQLKQHSCPEYVTMCNCTRCGGFAPKEYEKEDSDGLGD